MPHLFTPNYDEPTGRYCGPTAICAVTGVLLSDAKAAIRQSSGKITDAAGRNYRVSGVANKDLLGAMAILGWQVSEQFSAEIPKRTFVPDKSGVKNYGKWSRVGYKPNLFCDFLKERGYEGPFVVNVTGHYIAVGWGEILDAINPLGVDIEKYLGRKWKPGKTGRYQNAHVQRWWKFEAV